MKIKLLTPVLSLLFSAISYSSLNFAIAANYSAYPVVDLNHIDKQVNPCDDFYKFSCGGWLKNTPIPGDETRWYRFSEIDLHTEAILKDILTRYQKGDYTPRVKYAEKLGDLYSSCMDEPQVYQSAKIVLDLLAKKIQYIHSIRDMASVIGELHRMGVEALFSFSIDQDSTNATQMISNFGAGGTGLPEKSYYTDTSPEGKKLLEQYELHIAKMLQLSGLYSEKESQTIAKKVLAIESHLAEYSLSAEEQRDPTKLYNPKSWSEFTQLSSKFEWGTYLKRVGLSYLVGSSRYKMNVVEPRFYQGLDLLINQTKLEDLKSYIIWKTLSKTASLSSKALNDESFQFYGKILYGQTEESARWKKCLKQVNKQMGEALGEAFVQVAFGQEAKQFVSDMTAQIINEMRETVTGLDWINSTTKMGAYKKLDTLVKKIGYPDQFKNYDTLLISKTSLFANWIQSNRYEFDKMIQRLGKPVDRAKWDMDPQTNNAYYMPTLNEIVFPAGILQTPLFNVISSDAANIGATGATIGHELTHAFDDEGRQYDENGNLNNWWSTQVENDFKNKAQCLVDQYNQFSIVDEQDPSKPKLEDNPSFHVNGKLTLGENIADLGGLKLALNVYLKKHPDAFKDLPAESQGLTSAQLFFISYAQSWCGKSTFEALKNQVASDPHSPPKFRVNGVVTNLPQFAEAFQCTNKQKMNPVNKCSIW